MSGRAVPATATAHDHAGIVGVVQAYVDAWNQSDAARFREVFHEDARILSTGADGTLYNARIHDEVDGWASYPRADVVARILSVVQAGDVAAVLLLWDPTEDPGNRWVNVHTLLRIDGAWKMASKTTTHHTRAGWT